MQNVVPAGRLSRRSRNLLYVAAAAMLLAVLLLGLGFFLSGVPLVVPSNPSFSTYQLLIRLCFAAAALCGAGGLLMALRALTWKQDNPLAITTGDTLAQFLDNRYIFIRNISKRAIGYVDAVLVGPPGVLVFRICDKHGIFYNEAAHWMQQRDQGEWMTLSWSPTTEAIADISKVRDYLAANGVETPQVFGVVVFKEAPPTTTVTTQNPTVPVAQLDDLYEKLKPNYFSVTQRHDAATCTRIAELLYH
jgi:hypothetical protein